MSGNRNIGTSIRGSVNC